MGKQLIISIRITIIMLLIVSGAYGHSRLQEWMLGGVTEDLVVSSSKFVLLSH